MYPAASCPPSSYLSSAPLSPTNDDVLALSLRNIQICFCIISMDNKKPLVQSPLPLICLYTTASVTATVTPMLHVIR